MIGEWIINIAVFGWFDHSNCFAGETRFLTDEGTKTLAEMFGKTCKVLGTRAKWTNAEIKSFGIQKLLCVEIERLGKRKSLYVTADHRWPIPNHDDYVTTKSLKPDTKLVSVPYGWKVVSVTESNRVEEVFCAVVPEGHCFTLEDNILTCNCGDEAYKIAYPLLFPNHKFIFSDYVNEETKKADVFIVGGGDVLYKDILANITNINKKKYALSVTATFNSGFEYLKNFNGVYARDVLSLDRLAFNNIKAQYIPDLCTILKGDPIRGNKLLNEKHSKLLKKKIVVVLNAHLIVKPNILERETINFHKVCSDLSAILNNTEASCIFLPFCTQPPWDDRITNSWLFSKCEGWKNNLIIYDKLSTQDYLDIIAASDLVISTRLHASIFSFISQVPFIDITHHDKNLGFLKTINKTEWSNSYWKFEYAKMEKLIMELLEGIYDKKAYKDTYEQQLNILKKVANDVCFT